MPIFDNLDLELVGAEAIRRHRWEFHRPGSPGGTWRHRLALQPDRDVLTVRKFLLILAAACAFGQTPIIRDPFVMDGHVQ